MNIQWMLVAAASICSITYRHVDRSRKVEHRPKRDRFGFFEMNLTKAS